VFVGNLSFATTPEEVQTLFSEAGTVEEVFLPTDRNTGRAKGFAFVKFSSAAEAATAIETLNGVELDGRPIRVNEATEPPSRSPAPDRSGQQRGGYRSKKSGRPKGSRRNLRGRKRSL
jgi:RNA recognition motif-containing protein